MKSVSKILLCGFTGAGKSTFLQRLKGNVGWQYLDLDDAVHNEYYKENFPSLGEAIVGVGFDDFRKREEEKLTNLLNKQENIVLSLGGGSLNNRIIEFIKSKSDVGLLWLNVPFGECLKRAKASGGRPLLSKSDDELKKIYEERVTFYRQSHVVLDQKGIEAVGTIEQLLLLF